MENTESIETIDIRRVVIACSGGIDSTVTLASLLNRKFEVHPVSFVYPSKHNGWEVEAARKVCEHYGLKQHVVDLTEAFESIQSDLLVTGGKIPEGHYQAENMRNTVVPGRNGIFISVMAGIAQSIGYSHIAIGVHQGDHHIYPDCRPNFINAMAEAIHYQSEGKIYLIAPILTLDKKGIVALGLDLKVPFRLTRTCYKDQYIACGKCGSCQERLEAFELNGAVDPIQYA